MPLGVKVNNERFRSFACFYLHSRGPSFFFVKRVECQSNTLSNKNQQVLRKQIGPPTLKSKQGARVFTPLPLHKHSYRMVQ